MVPADLRFFEEPFFWGDVCLLRSTYTAPDLDSLEDQNQQQPVFAEFPTKLNCRSAKTAQNGSLSPLNGLGVASAGLWTKSVGGMVEKEKTVLALFKNNLHVELVHAHAGRTSHVKDQQKLLSASFWGEEKESFARTQNMKNIWKRNRKTYITDSFTHDVQLSCSDAWVIGRVRHRPHPFSFVANSLARNFKLFRRFLNVCLCYFHLTS